ncbi:MAG: bifunctional phosphoribosylaminoimidazolecarboxamide formyltransferase/IMP cyclohydrolase [Planctomycetes bacterium]|nr:bifunctional phosphoribosylaminoimidazolecarboxamide formyltransferase/IMP cyclohydrolase [Planctomycetota bacterium]
MNDLKIRRALISVTDKSNLAELAKGLISHGVEILSTGGTAAILRDAQIPVTEVAEVTRFPEILDGRVKTLHPVIYGGILALRDQASHREQMTEHGIEEIDLVVVNLYDFAGKAAKSGLSVEEAMVHVDIGGPCMIRAAAKNHFFVTVLTDPEDYGAFLKELEDKKGAISRETRRSLARKAFAYTAAYDAIIHQHLASALTEKEIPDRFSVASRKGQMLRYGENPHQQAAFYPLEGFFEPCVSQAEQLGGKKLSYNNLLDTDGALELVKEFSEPAAVIVKHTNPCGTALGKTINEAFEFAYAGDPLSAFGGIAALNRAVDKALAEEIADPKRFLEVLIAPEFEEDAVEILKEKVRWGKNLRILRTGDLSGGCKETRAWTFRSLTGGVLVQSRDLGIEQEELKTVTRATPDDETIKALRFAWKVVKHVRSNAIVLSKGTQVVGVGAGQMSRIDSTRIAGWKAGDRARGAVLASDAYFPFRDCVDQAAELGVRAVIQPGGSVRDAESIQAADEHGIAMVFTGARHFKH